MDEIKVKIKNLCPDLPVPRYMSAEAAGIDLLAAVEGEVEIEPGRIKLVPTGLCMAIPKGYEGQIRPRSGLALNHGLSMVNTPGTIDSDYRGEIKVILINFADTAYTIKRGQRIAQMIFNRIARADFTLVQDLEQTDRGRGGFGSTGN